MDANSKSKSIKMDVRIWFNDATGRIHISGPGFISTFAQDPSSLRGHPNLFRKLAKCLRDAGAASPASGH